MIDWTPYRPSQFQYVRPNEFRFEAKTYGMPAPPDSARALQVPDWAGEIERRNSDARSLATETAEQKEFIRKARERVALERSELSVLTARFAEKYGNFDPSISLSGLSDEGDSVELSNRAKQYLADIQTIDRKRQQTETLNDVANQTEANLARDLGTSEAMGALSAAGFDYRYATSRRAFDEGRAHFQEAGNRLAIYGAERELDHRRQDVRAAAVKAGNAALTAGLEGPALFSVNDDGSIAFDPKTLDHMSADARAQAQVKRLVEIMSARNGLSPLQGAVRTALDIQNAYIAAHPVVAGVLELPF